MVLLFLLHFLSFNINQMNETFIFVLCVYSQNHAAVDRISLIHTDVVILKCSSKRKRKQNQMTSQIFLSLLLLWLWFSTRSLYVFVYVICRSFVFTSFIDIVHWERHTTHMWTEKLDKCETKRLDIQLGQ